MKIRRETVLNALGGVAIVALLFYLAICFNPEVAP